MPRFALILGLTLTLALVSAAPAETIVRTAYMDTYVDSSQPAENFGQDNWLHVGMAAAGGSGTIRDLLCFDYGDLPTNPGMIASATLHACQFQVQGGSAGRTVGVYRVTSTWDEASVTWNTQPTVDASTVWATEVVGTNQDGGWITWDVTDLIRAQASGALPNCGLALCDLSEGLGTPSLGTVWSTEYIFNNNENFQLTIETVPEPGSLAALALASFAAFARRRS
ncbi:MAG: DNRLRE domain-containing protein [Phycisphaerae bacterium]|jgi:hypothetical protein